MHIAYWAPIVAFAIAYAASWWLIYSPTAPRVLDHPNERSLHESPIPRTGGIAIVGGLFIASIVFLPSASNNLWIYIFGLVGISCLDDMRGLPVIWRLGVHLAVAVAAAIQFLPDSLDTITFLIAVLGIAWMTNLYNFMDGSDGLAGGMAVWGFSFYGIACLLSGNVWFALSNFCVAAAAGGFLFFNFHPARIFMGDVGSVPLGFLAATHGMIGWQQGVWPLWFPLIVFSPFIVDASVTLARRLWQRKLVWEAHRDHYYQRLVRMGWGHRNTAFLEYSLMLLCGLCSLVGLAFSFTDQFTLLIVFGVFYIVVGTAIEQAWKKANKRARE